MAARYDWLPAQEIGRDKDDVDVSDDFLKVGKFSAMSIFGGSFLR